MLELLREQVRLIELMRKFARDQWKENDLMFPSSVGTVIGRSNFHKEWNRILETAGLPPMRFHDLRHMAASIMLVKLRRSPTEVASILGHAKTSTTLDIYGHMLPGMSQKTAKEIEDAVMPVRLPKESKS
jgi:integrase